MICEACRSDTSSNSAMKCKLCKSIYHYQCLNLSKAQFSSLGNEYLASWVCPSCHNITRRTKSNTNTPVKQHLVPLNAGDIDSSVNMSLDNSGHGSSQLGSETEPVTMESIGRLLDSKLQISFASFMMEFRNNFQNDVKKLVRSEMATVIEEVKNDYGTSIEFISGEQASLKAQLEEKCNTIKSLESKSISLRKDINNLNNRLANAEKLSRSCNVEIQAVPESRSENLIAIFKKLCSEIKVPIDDLHIQACRRVAKMDNSSKRPRNILVTLCNPRLRDTILSSTARFNKAHPEAPLNSSHLGFLGETSRIYVAEHLSPECKILHKKTRETAKIKEYKYVWVKYGRIYVRKNDQSGAILVKNEDFLSKL